MRQFLTGLLLLTSVFTKAQVVNIPDTAFEGALIAAGVDLNHDRQIQVSEALAVTNLTMNDSWADCNVPPGYDCRVQFIEDLTGIQSFANLQVFTLQGAMDPLRGLHNINLSGLGNLKRLEIIDNFTTYTLTLQGCTSLQALSIHSSTGYMDYGYTNTFDLRPCTNLDNIYFQGLSFNTMKVDSCVNLKRIQMVGVQFTTVTMDHATNLRQFFAEAARNQSGGLLLDFSNLTQLNRVEVWGSSLNDIRFNGCSGLDTVNLDWGFFTKSILDFSSCTTLKRLAIGPAYQNVGPLNFLNIKNGSILTYFSISDYCKINTVCADDFETAPVRTYLASRNNPTTNVFSYCSFYPGGNYNTITGKFRIDDNNNGCNNSGRPLVNIPVKFTDTTGQSVIVSSNNTGDYSVYTYKGLFSFMPYLPYAYFSINPANALVSFDTANSLVNTTNFCLQPSGVHNDLEINFLPIRGARPGFNAGYTLTYRNRGNTTLSGNISVNFDNGKMNFVAASVPVTTQNTGQLAWNYNNLLPLETRTIRATFNLLPPPVNNLNDTIIYLAAITPSANDETPFDNSFILPQRLTGSYDPNEKLCLEGSKIDISKIGEYLHYMVHFQNEGTDTAFNIVVADTLSDKLDWNSFEFIGSSHTCDAKLTNNKAEFFFADINLPYKAIDEPGSNGWLAFKIKPKPSVVIGDSLNNTAAIYFDFNLPVITNRVTTVVSSSSTPVPVKLEYFSVNKKNNTNLPNWKASCTYGNATFVIERSNDGIHFSSIGNINANSLRCQLPFNFTDNDPAAGKNYYRLKITDADGLSFYSKTIVVGNNKAGLEITALANNIVYLNSNKQQTITMKVIAGDGKELISQKQNVATGNNNIILQMKNTTRGLYILAVYSEEGETITKRFIK